MELAVREQKNNELEINEYFVLKRCFSFGKTLMSFTLKVKVMGIYILCYCNFYFILMYHH